MPSADEVFGLDRDLWDWRDRRVALSGIGLWSCSDGTDVNGPIYSAVNEAVLATIPSCARRVLDLGCGDGSLGQSLKRRQMCRVLGVTGSAEEARLARERLDVVLVRDLESWTPNELPPEPLDTIVCSHILEHLRSPRELLLRIAPLGRAGALLVVALPNIVHWRQRLRFLGGDFRYTAGGPLDETHLRFFDWTGAQKLFEGTGWKLQEASAKGHFPLLWRLGRPGRALDRAACRLLPNVFGEQFVLIARAHGDVERAA
jgi:SAM-dependent methyltransferase